MKKALFISIALLLSISAARADPILVALTDSHRQWIKTGKTIWTYRWRKFYQYRTADYKFLYLAQKIKGIPDNRTSDKRHTAELWFNRAVGAGNGIRLFTD